MTLIRLVHLFHHIWLCVYVSLFCFEEISLRRNHAMRVGGQHLGMPRTVSRFQELTMLHYEAICILSMSIHRLEISTEVLQSRTFPLKNLNRPASSLDALQKWAKSSSICEMLCQSIKKSAEDPLLHQPPLLSAADERLE